MSSITTGTGEVVLPRFKLEYESLLNDTLIRLGMGPAFDSYFADFGHQPFAFVHQQGDT